MIDALLLVLVLGVVMVAFEVEGTQRALMEKASRDDEI
jgi:hypothetical protein